MGIKQIVRISGFTLTGKNAENVCHTFENIALKECGGKLVGAFEKIVLEAGERRKEKIK